MKTYLAHGKDGAVAKLPRFTPSSCESPSRAGGNVSLRLSNQHDKEGRGRADDGRIARQVEETRASVSADFTDGDDPTRARFPVIVVDASAIVEMLLGTAKGSRVERRVFGSGETLHEPHLLDVEVLQVIRRHFLAK